MRSRKRPAPRTRFQNTDLARTARRWKILARPRPGEFAADLFAKDFQFCFPKYGVGHGAAAFSELFSGMMCAVKRVAHHLDTMLFIEQGNCVAAEGTTEGTDVHGVEWHGGRTRGGRFCSIFLFGQSGLIERLHIYMDPDCTGGHKEGFLWPKRSVDSW